MTPSCQITVVVPLLNEEESLPELCEWISRIMVEHDFTYEVLLVDDGSTDGSWNVIGEEAKKNGHVKGIRFRRNYGKAAALDTGFSYAKGDVVITMDADLQDSPDEIPDLYRMVKEEGFHVVSGWKKERHDSFIKNNTSKVYNAVTRSMSGIKLHDFNCGLKAYDHRVVKSIELQGEMHRYIPVIAKWAGFANIGEKVVKHQARKHGKSKFGMNRFVNGFLDLFTIIFVSRFGKKPMHLFGLWGTLSFMLGFGIALYFTIAKLAFQEYNMTERPLFYLGILAMIIGTQMFLAGFVSELIIRNSPIRNSYNIDEVIGTDEPS